MTDIRKVPAAAGARWLMAGFTVWRSAPLRLGQLGMLFGLVVMLGVTLSALNPALGIVLQLLILYYVPGVLLGTSPWAPGESGRFLASAIALAAGLLIARAITTSHFGKVMVAIRDAESRSRFLGYRVEQYKLFVWTVSAMMAGVAGALYVPQVGIVNPGEFAPANSIEIVIWVALGGRGTLVGAALGAIVVALAKTLLTGWLPDAWLYALGALFILVTLYLPKGVVGALNSLGAPARKVKEATA